MSEVVNIVVAFVVIVAIFRWITSGADSGERGPAEILGFRPKHVTPEMIQTVAGMFPDVPADNIRYDLLRTGNVQSTTEKILATGYLDPPPPSYYVAYPNNRAAPAADTQRQQQQNQPQQPAHPIPPSGPSLISRYGLQERVNNINVDPDAGSGKAAWEDTPEKREASLRERKAQMILAARQRLLEQEAKNGKRQ